MDCLHDTLCQNKHKQLQRAEKVLFSTNARTNITKITRETLAGDNISHSFFTKHFSELQSPAFPPGQSYEESQFRKIDHENGSPKLKTLKNVSRREIVISVKGEKF